ncbi:glutaredoxin family protein [bacterium]|nr:glutaredoxin family protein [bacterium]
MKITMYSTTWCSDCARTKMFFQENNIEYEEIDIEKNPKAMKIVEDINNGNRSVPTVIIDKEDGKEPQIKVEPSREELNQIFEI